MEKKTRRRGLAALAVVAAGALALVGCSSGGGGATTKELTLGKVPSEKTTITVWSFLPDNYDKGAAAYKKVIAGFEDEYPQVHVKLVKLPYPKYFDQVRNATVAQKGPDVVTMYGGSQAYSYRNGLFPLQDAMKPEVKKNLNFVDDNFSKDGNLYILPTGTYGYAMMANTKLFERAGLDPEKTLSSWSGFLDGCRALDAKGIQPIAAGWKDGFLFETFMYMISSQMMDSATLKKWVAGDIPVDDPLFRKATGHILQMNKAHCFGDPDKAAGLSMYDDSFDQYFSGKAAMMANGSLDRAEKSRKAQPGSVVLPLPQVPKSKFAGTKFIDAGAEGGWSVTRWTKSPQASLAFVNYLAGPKAQKTLWEMINVPPNLKNVEVEGTTPMQKQFLPLMQNPQNHTGFAAFPTTVLAVFERNAGSLMTGSMDEGTFLKQAQSAFTKSNK